MASEFRTTRAGVDRDGNTVTLPDKAAMQKEAIEKIAQLIILTVGDLKRLTTDDNGLPLDESIDPIADRILALIKDTHLVSDDFEPLGRCMLVAMFRLADDEIERGGISKANSMMRFKIRSET